MAHGKSSISTHTADDEVTCPINQPLTSTIDTFGRSGGDFGFGSPEEKRPPVPQPRCRGEMPVPSTTLQAGCLPRVHVTPRGEIVSIRVMSHVEVVFISVSRRTLKWSNSVCYGSAYSLPTGV